MKHATLVGAMAVAVSVAFAADPTGCPSFTVEKPRVCGSKVVRAVDFGFSTSVDDNGAALRRALAEAARIGADTVELAPGTYRCFSPKGIAIIGRTDFTLDGKGATLVFRRPLPTVASPTPQWAISHDDGCFVIKDCVRTHLRDFNVDWDWATDPLASKARVVAVHAETPSYVDFDLPDGHPAYPEQVPMVVAEAMDTTFTRLRNGPGHFFAANGFGGRGLRNEWIGPKRLRVHFPANAREPASRFDVGGAYRLLHSYYGDNAFTLDSNRHLTVSRVNVFAARGMAFHVSGKQRYWRLENCSVAPPAGSGRVISSTADANHVAQSCGYCQMVNFKVNLNSDDCNNFHDRTTIAVKSGARGLRVVNTRGPKFFGAKAGDRIELLNADFSPADWNGRIVRVTEDGYEMDRETPKESTYAFVLANREYGTDNILLSGCEFVDATTRTLIHGCNVTVENCTWKRTGATPLRFLAVWTKNAWCEGTGCRNVVVRNCSFEGDNVWRWNVRDRTAEIVSFAFTPERFGEKPGDDVPEVKPWDGAVADILVENCVFTNPIDLTWQQATGTNLVSRGNRVVRTGVRASVGEREMGTYPFSDPDPVPATDAVRYPYFRYDGSTDRMVTQAWQTVTLENDRIRVVMLPQVGGKVWSATDKATGRDFLYCNHVMKFRDIAMRGPWVSGGIEFNFGIIGHAPSSSTPVDWFVRTNADESVSCFVSSPEYITRTLWQVEVRLEKGADCFETRTSWFNASGLPGPLYHWMNAAYSVRGDPEFHFPGSRAIGHEGEIVTAQWPCDAAGHELDRYSGNAFGGPKSYHVLPGNNGYYAIWWPEAGFGSFHKSLPYEKFGRKIWLWALSREGGIWEDLLTDADGQYAELQSGLCFNQPRWNNYRTPFKHPEFSPGATMRFSEAWGPVRTRPQIDAETAMPQPESRPLAAPENFNWESAWGHYVRGVQFIRERHDREGAEELRTAVAKDCFLVPAWSALAAFELRRGDTTAARGNAAQALALDAYDPLANYIDGFACFIRGDVATSRERLGVAALDAGFKSPALALVARGYLRNGRSDEALAAARKSLTANPWNLDARLAELVALRDRPEEAESRARLLLDEWPLFHAARYELDRLDGREDCRSLVRNELPSETYLDLGSWYEDTGFVDDARRFFRWAGDSPVAWIRLGELETAKKRSVAGVFPFRRESLPALERAVAADGHWKFRYLLAVLKDSFGFVREAAELLDGCGELPDESVFYQYRARFRQGVRRLDDLKRAQALGDSWRIGRQLAACYEEAADFDGMLKVTTDYLRRYPKNNPLEIARGRALLGLKRYHDVLDFLAQVKLLPSEHRDSGTEIWQAAQKALGLELTWPENLGRGKPFAK